MATVDTDNPILAEAMQEVTDIRNFLQTLAQRRDDAQTRGKYAAKLTELEENMLPFLELSKAKFSNESVSSIGQQFKKNAAKMKLTWEPCVIQDHEGRNFLVNFDAEQVEAKLNAYLAKRANITPAQLAQISNDLDKDAQNAGL